MRNKVFGSLFVLASVIAIAVVPPAVVVEETGCAQAQAIVPILETAAENFAACVVSNLPEEVIDLATMQDAVAAVIVTTCLTKINVTPTPALVAANVPAVKSLAVAKANAKIAHQKSTVDRSTVAPAASASGKY